MGEKHGIWFDLMEHIAIHDSVIKKNQWQIKSGENQYSYKRSIINNTERLLQSIQFETHNSFQVQISKETLISNHDRKLGITKSFSYNCRHLLKKYHLRYHAPHSPTYNPNAPWHDRTHRHEFNGAIQKIDIYSYDHRPKSEQAKSYKWKNYPVSLTFLEHENWPFVSEFLDEVSQLKI